VIRGVLLTFAGLGLLGGQRRGALVRDLRRAPRFFAQLGLLGNSQYSLWELTALTLEAIVLYALTARWSESETEIASVG
jgi:hypothetical protein